MNNQVEISRDVVEAVVSILKTTLGSMPSHDAEKIVRSCVDILEAFIPELPL